MTSSRLLAGAQKDLRQAVRWYRKRSPRATVGFEKAVRAAVSQLIGRPMRWPLCDDVHRVCPLKRYPFAIIYRIASEEILVVAIAHAKRDPDYWKGR